MCLAQGPQHSDAGEAQSTAPRSRVKHSYIKPLRSRKEIVSRFMCYWDGVSLYNNHAIYSYTKEP